MVFLDQNRVALVVSRKVVSRWYKIGQEEGPLTPTEIDSSSE